MAVKYAITNGAFTSGATWNDGSVPAEGDYVYANGHAVSATNAINIGNGWLSNEPNADYGIVAGGGFNISSIVTITANLRQNGTATLITASIGGNDNIVNIIGNIYNDGGLVLQSSTQQRNSINITGNIYIGDSAIFLLTSNYAPAAYFTSLILNGNVFKVGNAQALYGYTAQQRNLVNVSVTGNLEVSVQNNISYATPTVTGTLAVGGKFVVTAPMTSVVNASINDMEVTDGSYIAGTTIAFAGDVKIGNSAYISFTTANYNGSDGVLTIGHSSRYSATNHNFNGRKIEYYNDSRGIGGVSVSTNNTFTPTNPDFQWLNISDPRTLKYRIMTDYDFDNTEQYPAENRVVEGVVYAFGEKNGTFAVDYPPESVVLNGYIYDNGDKTGSMSAQAQVGCVTKEDVREGVSLIGMGEVGTLVVPSVDDVREGVVFDNGSVGTLIVQGGGDRLRIADFGYYTRSTSITYIVDLTESDKPAFADCEQIVLLSLFPTLDLDNIPDKFFDDLFVQFLRYRLLVEYYRGISVNSKFTPSEPTTEIVNYANTKCEYWLNTANLFLQLWGEKYPNSVKKDRILL